MFVFHVYGTRVRDEELPAIKAHYHTQKNGMLSEFPASNAPVGAYVDVVDAMGQHRRHIVVINVTILGDAYVPDEHLLVAFPI